MALIDVEIPRWSIDLIYGNTNSGKSYFAGWLVEQAYEQGRRFIVLDTKVKNHVGLVQLPGVKLVKIKRGYRYNWKRFLELDQVLVIPTPGVVKSIGVEGLVERYYKPLLETINNSDRDRIVVLEEAHHYCLSSRRPDKEIEFIFREGRGQRLYPVAITQSIADFPKLLFRQAKRHFIFMHHIPNDKFYLSKMIPNFEALNSQLREHDLIEYIPPNQTRIIRREYIIRRTKHYG